MFLRPHKTLVRWWKKLLTLTTQIIKNYQDTVILWDLGALLS